MSAAEPLVCRYQYTEIQSGPVQQQGRGLTVLGKKYSELRLFFLSYTPLWKQWLDNDNDDDDDDDYPCRLSVTSTGQAAALRPMG